MRTLLIAPRTGQESLEVVPVRREPLGACYISAALKQAGHESKVLHQIEISDDELMNEIRAYQPELVGFSTMTYNTRLDLADRVRKEFDLPLVIGGDHVSGCAVSYPKYPDLLEDLLRHFDFGVVGEGERTIVELVEALEGKRDLESVNGIVYSKNGEVYFTKPRERIKDLDSLPFPDRDLEWEKYRSYGITISKPGTLATQHTSRGCRFHCDFCSTPTTWGKGWVARSSKNVVDETQYLVENLGLNFIWFADEDFFADKQRVYGICEEIKRRNLKDFNWYCFGKATDYDEDLFRLMKDTGCVNVFFGIESMNEATLKRIHKGIRERNIQKALNTAKKSGLNTWGTFMLGYPWEDEDALLTSLRKLEDLNLDYLYLSFLTPFPGNPLYEECRDAGLLLTEDFTQYDCCRPVIKTPFAPERLAEIRKSFQKEFHSSPNYIIRMLENIRKGFVSVEQYIQFYNHLFNE